MSAELVACSGAQVRGLAVALLAGWAREAVVSSDQSSVLFWGKLFRLNTPETYRWGARRGGVVWDAGACRTWGCVGHGPWGARHILCSTLEDLVHAAEVFHSRSKFIERVCVWHLYGGVGAFFWWDQVAVGRGQLAAAHGNVTAPSGLASCTCSCLLMFACGTCGVDALARCLE